MSEESGEVSVRVSTRPDPDTIHAWDHLVSHTPRSDVAQLSTWSAVRRQAGFVPRYVLTRRAGWLVDGAVILQRRLPVLGVVGYVPHGPVIGPDPGRSAVAHAVSTALADLGHRHLSGLAAQAVLGGCSWS